MKHKMYCIFAEDSVKKMSGIRGKMCTQAGHAYVHTMLRALQQFPQHVQDYLNSGHAYKITLIVQTEPTTTCLGIGPLSEELIGDDLKALKTFT